ncbi:hypothetical protein L5515_013048 [Caenorhabditis briggsae]|uniref:Poly(A) RNA polymerase mitochondrial-like central palm domain-containing protein n=1 Tax=Caenorhabditis briggsae TaxID=6238 RepID=A0AAE9E9I9_CAEBR|nr:hypothetical protein L5515_013048 [Caenorhabditis briggsae]
MPPHQLNTAAIDVLLHLENTVPSKNEHLQELHWDLQKFHKDHMQSSVMRARKNRYIDLIRDFLKSEDLKKNFPPGIFVDRLVVFGSFATHCASKFSDLDLCVCMRYNGFCDPNRKPPPIWALRSIHYHLIHHRRTLSEKFDGAKIEDVEFISNAKVPILRFKIDGVPVDLSASFSDRPPKSCLAAKLINAYCQLDDRFAILVTFLKMWLKSEGDPVDHLKDFPNSYSLILLLIHVLQWYRIVPNLYQTHAYLFNHHKATSWDDVDLESDEFWMPLDQKTIICHQQRPSKHLTVVQLLYLFGTQYTTKNRLDEYSFNMKTGALQLKKSREYSLSIIDIYDENNPGRSARDTEYLVEALRLLTRTITDPRHGMLQSILEITSQQLYEDPERPSILAPDPTETTQKTCIKMIREVINTTISEDIKTDYFVDILTWEPAENILEISAKIRCDTRRVVELFNGPKSTEIQKLAEESLQKLFELELDLKLIVCFQDD